MEEQEQVQEQEPKAEEAAPARKSGKRTFVGTVTSDKMQKTIVVTVSRKKMDPLYKKYVTRSKKYMAHDEKEEANIGDTVRIIESRPLSRRKRWRLDAIIERVK